MVDSSLLSNSCSAIRLPDMLTVTPKYNTACVMFGNCAQVERRRSGGQSEREKRAESLPAHGLQDLRLTSRRSRNMWEWNGRNQCKSVGDWCLKKRDNHSSSIKFLMVVGTKNQNPCFLLIPEYVRFLETSERFYQYGEKGNFSVVSQTRSRNQSLIYLIFYRFMRHSKKYR